VFRFVFVCNVFWVVFQRYCCRCGGWGGGGEGRRRRRRAAEAAAAMIWNDMEEKKVE
jgi:hypothetical protein